MTHLSLQCPPMSSPLDPPSQSGCTEVHVQRLTYEWVIKELSFLPQELGEGLFSPTFCTDDKQVEWNLCFYPKGKTEQSSTYSSLYLHLHSHKATQVQIKVHADLSIGFVSHKFVHIYEEKEGHGFMRMIQRAKLLKSCGPDDSLMIRCKINIPGETTTESVDVTQNMDLEVDSQVGKLSQSFRQLWRESKLSDVTIIVGSNKLLAHKVILAARSPVFSAMFEHKDTEENIKNEVKIEKMQADVVEAMLEFLYTDEVVKLDTLAFELLEAADKYDIQRLRTLCERVLYRSINEENAAQILVHADRHRSRELKLKVLEFMVDRLPEVVRVESYREMKGRCPALLDELIQLIAARMNCKE